MRVVMCVCVHIRNLDFVRKSAPQILKFHNATRLGCFISSKSEFVFAKLTPEKLFGLCMRRCVLAGFGLIAMVIAKTYFFQEATSLF